MRTLLWFRRDLRLHDLPPLLDAAASDGDVLASERTEALRRYRPDHLSVRPPSNGNVTPVRYRPDCPQR
jgi:hypothetical protein